MIVIFRTISQYSNHNHWTGVFCLVGTFVLNDVIFNMKVTLIFMSLQENIELQKGNMSRQIIKQNFFLVNHETCIQ